MNDYFASLAFAYLPLLVVAIMVWWLMLRFLDWLGGIKFKRDVAPGIRRDPLGSAIYFGARLIAVAIVVYGVFGAVRF